MLEEYLSNGRLMYCENISKKGRISKDLFQIDYRGRSLYLLCTFDGLAVTHTALIA